MILRYFFNLDERGVECGILECRWNGRMVRGRLFFFFQMLEFHTLMWQSWNQPAVFPSAGNFSPFFLFISFFLTSAEQGQKIAYPITVPETRDEASLSSFCHREGGRMRWGPFVVSGSESHGRQEDSLSEGSRWALFPASRGTQAGRGGTSGLRPSVPTRGKGQSAGDCLLQHT